LLVWEIQICGEIEILLVIIHWQMCVTSVGRPLCNPQFLWLAFLTLWSELEAFFLCLVLGALPTSVWIVSVIILNHKRWEWWSVQNGKFQKVEIRFFRLKKSNEMQEYADIYLLLNYCTCFGRPSRPSSWEHKTVVAAFGTDHTIWGASYLKRDQIRTKSLFGHVAATVFCSPDDGRDGRLKHVA